MKILIITARIPFPPFRGDKLRIFNVIKSLAKRNEVMVLSFLKDSSDKKFLDEFRLLGFNIEVIYLSKVRSMVNLLRSLFNSDPLQVSYYHSRQMHNKVSELTSKINFDVIYFHLFTVAQYQRSVADRNVLTVLDFTDATSLYLKRYLEFLNHPLEKLYFGFERKRIFKYETIAKHFNAVFVCSKVDQKYLSDRKIHPNIKLFTNGIDSEIYKYESAQYEKFRIIFTGNMPYFPNKDAVLYFANEIFPIVLKKEPRAKFFIVGQNPSQEILNLRSNSIIVTGLVADIKKEYLKSEVNVAPVRFGAGTPNKISEALALGIPTVATSLTISGFPDEIKKFIYTADTPEEFTAKIINVFNDGSIRSEFMKIASKAVVELFNWTKVVNDLEDYLLELKKI